MFKKIILVIILSLVFVGLVQFTKESILNNPQRIYNKIYPKYKNLEGLSAKDMVYSPKRTLTYSLRYMNIIPMGKATMSAQAQGRNILLKGVADTPSLVTKFYKAQAQVQAVISKNKLYPFKYLEITETPDKKRQKEIVFYPDKNIAEREGKKYKIPSMTFCPISAFYYLQLQDLSLGKIHKIKLLSKEEIYVLDIKVTEEKDGIVKLEGQVRREDLSSRHGASFEFFVSKKYRVPLLIKVKTSVGIIVARAM